MLTSMAPVFSPKNLDEALAFRRDHPNAMPLAGGTDLMVGIELGAVKPEQILNLWRSLRCVQCARTLTVVWPSVRFAPTGIFVGMTR